MNKTLSPDYFDYVKLQRRLRKAISQKDVNSIELLSSDIKPIFSRLTEFESSYADWLFNEVFDYRPATDSYHGIDVEEIKDEIKALAFLLEKEKVLGKYKSKERAAGNPIPPKFEIPEKYTSWPEEFDVYYKKYRKTTEAVWALNRAYINTAKRYTQLCALRAAMRGKMHFSPNSDLTYLHDELGMYGDDWNYCPSSNKWCGTLDLEVQREWVEELVWEFQPSEEKPKVKIKKQVTKKLWWQKVIEVVLG